MPTATNEHCFNPLLHDERKTVAQAFSTPVVVVFFMAICTMLVISCVDWTLLLFLNYSNSLTDAHDVYFNASAMALLVPVCANPILGILSARFGSGTTICYSYLVVALGILMMTLFRQSVILFYVTYEVYALCTTLRIVRLSILAQVVPSGTRTTVMAVHQLMAPIGAMLGPMIWILIQKWRGHLAAASWIVIDRFFLNYLVSIGVLLCMFFVGMGTIRSLPTAAHETSEENGDPSGSYNSMAGAKNVKVHADDGLNASMPTNVQGSGIQRFTFFCTLTLLMQSTMALVRVSFQPVLIGVYGADDEQVGKMYGIVGVLAIVPPVAVALLSRVVKDRDIMLIGMVLKLCGVLLCLPVFGEVRKWQLVAGFMLCIKASNFFTTAAFSAFTKTTRGKKTAKQLGYFWSICSVGPAVVQFCFASVTVSLFGSWGYSVCAIPLLAGFVLVFHPWGWRLLTTH